MRERSLVAFTLLGQLAVGIVWAQLVAAGAEGVARPAGTALLVAGPIMIVAMAVSLLHLGSPSRAWRAVANVRSSWLSREIVSAGLFTLGWAAAVAVGARGAGPAVRLAFTTVAAGLGVALVYSMARVYRLRTVPAWRTRLTTLSFFLTTAALGTLAVAAAAGPGAAGSLLPLAALVLAVELWLERGWSLRRARARERVDPGLNAARPAPGPLRPTLLWVALAAVAAASLAGGPGSPSPLPAWAGWTALVLAFLAALGAEARGRSAFYHSYARTGLALAVLAGLTGAPGAAAAQGARAARAAGFPTLAEGAGPGEGAVAGCTLPGVTGPTQCGVFRVDEDGTPGGRTVDLHFAVLEALAAEPAPDPVIFFTGGPGAPTVASARGIGAALAEVRARRDLLLVDLRGIALSGALDCDVGYPGGLASRFGTLLPPDHVALCRDVLSRRADLDAYTTPASVDDVEALRSWLGYPRVNLYGGSYGSRVAQVYMRRHPDAVRTVVLNGVTPLDQPGYLEMAGNLQAALDRLVAECADQDECRTAYPDLDARLTALLARFADGPVEVDVDGRVVPFSAGDLGYALRGLLYQRAADIPWLVSRTADGDLSPAVRYFLQRTAWVGSTGGGAGSHLSALCPEDIAPVTDDDVRRATAGTFLGDYVIRSYREACRIWPTATLPEGFFDPVVSDIPTLLLSGERDPATPPSGGDRVARTLSRSLHVVVPNGGHDVLNQCTLRMVVRLLEAGSIDAVDPSCVTAVPPTRFRRPER